jgi:hypothetical protein
VVLCAAACFSLQKRTSACAETAAQIQNAATLKASKKPLRHMDSIVRHLHPESMKR